MTIESQRPKVTKSEDELATMIREDLLKVDGCPQRGVSVRVYGIPWKAMLCSVLKQVRSTIRPS